MRAIESVSVQRMLVSAGQRFAHSADRAYTFVYHPISHQLLFALFSRTRNTKRSNPDLDEGNSTVNVEGAVPTDGLLQ